MKNRASIQVRAQAELRPMLGVRFSAMLEMGESELGHLTSLLEEDPVFQKLFRTTDPNQKVIHRQRFPSSRFAYSTDELPDVMSAASAPSQSAGEVMDENADVIEQIQKMGQAEYESYFLYENGERTPQETAVELGLPEELAKKIIRFTERVLLRYNFSDTPSPLAVSNTVSPELQTRHSRVAMYRADSDGKFELSFFSPLMARGIYRINYERLKQLKKSGSLSKSEKKQVDQLIRWLELINSRKRIIFRLLQLLPDRQKELFASGDWDHIRPLTQRTAAQSLSVTPAAVCRAIQNRSVVIPQGQEVSLISLFPSKKDVLKRQIAPLIEKNISLSDRVLQGLIEKQFSVKLSRRSVNVYRNELKSK